MASEIMQLGVTDPLSDLVGSYLGGAAGRELPPAATREDALVRAASIRAGIERFAREVVPQVGQAYLCRDWAALGHPSWEAYVRAEFGLHRLRLPRGDRQDAVGTLRLLGMSTRAIGQTLGVDQKTVVNDLRPAKPGEENSSPAEPAEVVGADGKRYAPGRPVPAQVVAPEPAPRKPAVVPEPASPDPQPLTPPAAAPVEAPAAAAVVADQGTELVAGPVRIRVRARRRPDRAPVVALDLARPDWTLGEAWQAGDNDDPVELGAELDEAELDDLINTLLDAKAQLRRLRDAQ